MHAERRGLRRRLVSEGLARNRRERGVVDAGPGDLLAPDLQPVGAVLAIAFETDLPRIEATGLSPNNNCERFSETGTGCVNPSNGAEFYPLFVARTTGQGCLWYEAGSAFPGQTQTFGGSSTTEFGPLLRLDYPSPTGNLPRFNDFRNVVPNSCPSP